MHRCWAPVQKWGLERTQELWVVLRKPTEKLGTKEDEVTLILLKFKKFKI